MSWSIARDVVVPHGYRHVDFDDPPHELIDAAVAQNSTCEPQARIAWFHAMQIIFTAAVGAPPGTFGMTLSGHTPEPGNEGTGTVNLSVWKKTT